MSELHKLPDGWEWKKLDELTEVNIGKTPTRSKKEFFLGNKVWLSIRDLKSFFISTSNEMITDEAITATNLKLIKKGTLLMSFKLTLGRTAFADSDLYTNEAITSLPIKDENVLDKYFLKYSLQIIDLEKEVDNAVKGKTLNKQKIKNLDIPLPSLLEQQRIVFKLDNLFEKINKSITLHQKNIDEANIFMGSVLSDVFGELEEEYGTIPISSVMKINNQTVIPNDDETYNYVGLENIESDSGKLVNYEPSIGKNIKSSKVHFKRGMVLYGKLRPYLNKVWIADFDGIATTEILPFFPIGNNLNMQYVKHYFLSPKYLATVMSNCSGARMPRLTTKFIKSDEAYIPMPSLETQEKIVAYLNNISKKIEKIKSVQKEKMESLVALKASILDQAFRGEL
jgi:type I restriction enzyme S subunit